MCGFSQGSVEQTLFFRGYYCAMGSLSNDDAYGVENVGLFHLVQFRSNVGNFLLELNSKSYIEVRKRKRKSLFCVHVLQEKLN